MPQPAFPFTGDWIRWTGPNESDWDMRARGARLNAPVPPERWPWGPPSAHQASCALKRSELYCDCSLAEQPD